VANGLSRGRFRKQWKTIDELKKVWPQGTPVMGLGKDEIGYCGWVTYGASGLDAKKALPAVNILFAFEENGRKLEIAALDPETGRIKKIPSMNDKCAAGTGRFLENTGARLGIPIDELGRRALATTEEEAISSTCTVFAESETEFFLRSWRADYLREGRQQCGHRAGGHPERGLAGGSWRPAVRSPSSCASS
jgi:hypothetical protein